MGLQGTQLNPNVASEISYWHPRKPLQLSRWHTDETYL